MEQPPQRRGGLSYEQFAELLALMTSSPFEHVATVLRHHGPTGTPFKAAWASAMRSLPRGHDDASRADSQVHRDALHFQRAAWQARYEELWPATKTTLADAVRGRRAA